MLFLVAAFLSVFFVPLVAARPPAPLLGDGPGVPAAAVGLVLAVGLVVVKSPVGRVANSP
jgi:hypothetical protein